MTAQPDRHIQTVKQIEAAISAAAYTMRTKLTQTDDHTAERDAIKVFAAACMKAIADLSTACGADAAYLMGDDANGDNLDNAFHDLIAAAPGPNAPAFTQAAHGTWNKGMAL